MKRHALLGVLLVACGGGPAATTTPEPRGGAADCHQAQALKPPGKRDNAPGYRAGVICEDGACDLTVSHEGVTRSFALEAVPGESLVGVRRDDLDGDGADELMVLATMTATAERSLTIVDATTLELRWSAPAWSSEPPSAACTSTAELRDDDCDGRRETLVQRRRCDAGDEETLTFGAAAAGEAFTAVTD